MSAPSFSHSQLPLQPTFPTALEAEGRSHPSRLIEAVALGAVLGLGIWFRMAHYLAARSLWIDEARLALDILSRSYSELLRPLEYDQAAPPLFLWAERAAVAILGVHEWSLRLVPLLGSLVALLTTYPLARRYLRTLAAVLAVTTAAFGPLLIYYSNEVKPYSLDAALTAILLWLSVTWIESQGKRSVWPLLLTGTIAPWISTPAPFVLAGIILAVLSSELLQRRRKFQFMSGMVLAWLVSFGVAYGAVYGPASRNQYLKDFWSYSFLDPGRPDFWARVWQGVRDTLWGVFLGTTTELPLGRQGEIVVNTGAALILLAACLGGYHLLRSQGRWKTALLIGPLAAVGLASTVRLYPVAFRVMLFSSPILHILVAAGVAYAAAKLTRSTRPVVLALVGTFIVALPFLASVQSAVARPLTADHRGAIAELQAKAGPLEPIYVSAGSLPPWVFYTTDWSSPDTLLLRRMAALGSSGGPAFENGQPRDTVLLPGTDELVYQSGGRLILIGLYTGMQVRAGLPFARYRPDPGWGEVEAERIREVAKPSIWLLMSHLYGAEPAFYRRLYLAGGRATYRTTRRDVLIARYVFK